MSCGRSDHGLKALLRAADCPALRRGWHSLRHTFASMFLRAGGNLCALQKILGHCDVKMTLTYAHLAPDFLAEDLERIVYPVVSSGSPPSVLGAQRISQVSIFASSLDQKR
jgi:integrase